MLNDKKLDVEVCQNIEDVKEIWLALEQSCPVSIYQKYDWVQSWCMHLLGDEKNQSAVKPFFVTISLQGASAESDKQTLAILPFCIKRKKGVKFLSWLGDEHFNYQGGLFDERFLAELTEHDFRTLWKRINSVLPYYRFIWFNNQSIMSNGIMSPFRWLNQQTSPNSGHQLVYKYHDWDVLLAELRSKSTRKRMRNEESRLAREGQLTWKRVDAPHDIEFYLDILFQQRQDRFQQLGVAVEDDIAAYKKFYLNLLHVSAHQEQAMLYLKVIELDNQVLATMLLGENGNKTYLLINSMTSTHYSKWSPGDFLIRLTLQAGCQNKTDLIDFGLSEDSNYKTAWCNTKLDMFETIKGRDVLGHVCAFVIRSRSNLKRKIKQTPTLWMAYRALRSGNFKYLIKTS